LPERVRFAWSCAAGAVIMSRMGKEPGESRLEGARGRLELNLRHKRSALTPKPNPNGDFVRAFADALRDILNHERRRAA
jgi:hypothetical protein